MINASTGTWCANDDQCEGGRLVRQWPLRGVGAAPRLLPWLGHWPSWWAHNKNRALWHCHRGSSTAPATSQPKKVRYGT